MSYVQRLGREAVTYQGPSKSSGYPSDGKVNYDSILEKENLGIEEKSLGSN